VIRPDTVQFRGREATSCAWNCRRV